MKSFIFIFLYTICTCVYFTFVASLTQIASNIALFFAIALFVIYCIITYFIIKKYGKKLF